MRSETKLLFPLHSYVFLDLLPSGGSSDVLHARIIKGLSILRGPALVGPCL